MVIGEGWLSTYPAPTYKYCACRSNVPDFTLAWAVYPMPVRSLASSSEKIEVVEMQAAFLGTHVMKSGYAHRTP